LTKCGGSSLKLHGTLLWVNIFPISVVPSEAKICEAVKFFGFSRSLNEGISPNIPKFRARKNNRMLT
jgi:hypothetical protein